MYYAHGSLRLSYLHGIDKLVKFETEKSNILNSLQKDMFSFYKFM